MFTKSAEFYDAIYEAKGKKYESEVSQLLPILERHGAKRGGRLLELACGTGNHTRYLNEHFSVEGLDLDPSMLAIARERFPDVPFHCQDMTAFSLNGRFDVILCLFSAIGYAKTPDHLRRALATMGSHLAPGGILVVEPWISPAEYRPGGVFSVFVDRPAMKVARMNVNEVRGTISVINFHYMVATPAGVQYFTEDHELGLYTREEYLAAFRDAGLKTDYEPEGLIGRGMYIARSAPLSPR
jgi:SAM-dependent methyltransferase